MKIIRILVLIHVFMLFVNVQGQTTVSSVSSRPGAFSRMGFGPRGIAMGNSMASVAVGNMVAYYNPALSVFQQGNSVQLGYSFLSLDRKLNFLSFTKRFDFFSDKDTQRTKPASTAGFSIGVINSGVTKIDERDNSGFKTAELSTSENQFFISVANKFSDKLALGLSIKFYYYKLFEKISSTSLGIDIGALYSLSDRAKLSFSLVDLNSKYEWDTSPIYEKDGRTSEDKFPTIKKVGFSYRFVNPDLIASVEYEGSNAQANILRFGAEYRIIEALTLRAGMDKLNLSNRDVPVRPSMGFSVSKKVDNIFVSLDYAFMKEPYSSHDQHVAGLSLVF